MTGRAGRYPHFTREDLGPTGCHRDAVFLRDDYRCLAARSVWARAHPCAGGLVLHRAASTTWRLDAALGPLQLRTFCLVHATLAVVDEAFQTAALNLGWSIPPTGDVAGYAAAVPVRYPNQRWYRLDDWADRHPLTGDEVLTARARLGFPPPVRRPT